MKLDSRSHLAWTFGVLASFYWVADTRAATIVLSAIQDTVITHNTTLNTTPLNNQLLDIRGGSNTANTSTTKRYGVIEFDLSGVTDQIVGAEFQLYMLPNTAAAQNNGLTTVSALGLPLTAHLDETTLTWSGANAYTSRADLDPAGVAMTDLGKFTFSGTGAVPLGQYYADDVSAASAGDLAFLEARRTNAFPFVAFLLNPNSTSGLQWHTWGDHESGFAPQLVLTTVPEPSACILFAIGLSCGLFSVRRKIGWQ